MANRWLQQQQQLTQIRCSFQLEVVLSKLCMNLVVPDCCISVILSAGVSTAETSNRTRFVDRLACFNKESIAIDSVELEWNGIAQIFTPFTAELQVVIHHGASAKKCAGKIDIDLAYYANNSVFRQKEQRVLSQCPDPTARLFYEIRLVEAPKAEQINYLPSQDSIINRSNLPTAKQNPLSANQPVTSKPEERKGGVRKKLCQIIAGQQEILKLKQERVYREPGGGSGGRVLDGLNDDTIMQGVTVAARTSKELVEQTIDRGGVRRDITPVRLEMSPTRRLFKQMKEENGMLATQMRLKNLEIVKLSAGTEILKADGLKLREIVKQLEQQLEDRSSKHVVQVQATTTKMTEVDLKQRRSEERLNKQIEELRRNEAKLKAEVAQEKTVSERLAGEIAELREKNKCEEKSALEQLKGLLVKEIQKVEDLSSAVKKKDEDYAVRDKLSQDIINELRKRVLSYEAGNQSKKEDSRDLKLEVESLQQQIAESIKRREEEVEDLHRKYKDSDTRALQLSKDLKLLSLNYKDMEDKVAQLSKDLKLANLNNKELELKLNLVKESERKGEEEGKKHHEEVVESHQKEQIKRKEAEEGAEVANLNLSSLRVELGALEISNARLKKEFRRIDEENLANQQNINILVRQLLLIKQTLADCVNVTLMSGDKDIADMIADHLTTTAEED